MAQCEVCGNDYYKSFDVVGAGVKHTFDSFERAIHALAPASAHCGCRVTGQRFQESSSVVPTVLSRLHQPMSGIERRRFAWCPSTTFRDVPLV